MGVGFAPTWLCRVSPPPASQNHFNHCFSSVILTQKEDTVAQFVVDSVPVLISPTLLSAVFLILILIISKIVFIVTLL